ncbi:HEY [Lepeophtheirus salmonis]|uniref:HEY n=1 Tax=Lepeophtheirus salmonis TaxID=72036 RepID=A0A7R8H3L1_LEPSM|nr:HEY [Lepeophtheirus salmonis]CAF2847578.1 HEY [Lepeophtheirus salmonis]
MMMQQQCYEQQHVKRSHSESDSDDGSRCHEVSGSGIGPNNRKRRRGMIEKRRRERINTSLGELKKLVPTALEKSGSAKLEKAEILQMTVEHLKEMQNNPNNAYDQTSKYEYQIMGIRECVAEVSRYLVSIEGMDSQDPLKLRLISHLQMYASQRASGTPPPPPPHPHPSHPATQNQHHFSHHQNWNYNYNYILPTTTNTTAVPPDVIGKNPSETSHHLIPSPHHEGYTSFHSVSSPDISSSPTSLHHPYYSNNNGYPQHSVPSSTQLTSSSHQNTVSSSVNNYGSKPYRPWGAEMAC